MLSREHLYRRGVRHYLQPRMGTMGAALNFGTRVPGNLGGKEKQSTPLVRPLVFIFDFRPESPIGPAARDEAAGWSPVRSTTVTHGPAIQITSILGLERPSTPP